MCDGFIVIVNVAEFRITWETTPQNMSLMNAFPKRFN